MKTIIVIDDDYDLVDILKDVWEVFGLSVVGMGYDGKDAVELYEKYKPDLVCIDIMMPKYDGFYAIEKIRKINPNSPIIAVTAVYDGEIINKLKQLGVEIISKPFNIKKCGQILEKLVPDIPKMKI